MGKLRKRCRAGFSPSIKSLQAVIEPLAFLNILEVVGQFIKNPKDSAKKLDHVTITCIKP